MGSSLNSFPADPTVGCRQLGVMEISICVEKETVTTLAAARLQPQRTQHGWVNHGLKCMVWPGARNFRDSHAAATAPNGTTNPPKESHSKLQEQMTKHCGLILSLNHTLHPAFQLVTGPAGSTGATK